MDEHDRLQRLIHTARETARYVLEDLGVLFPFALTLGDDGEVNAYFPRAELPEADGGELLSAAEANLRQRITEGTPAGVALITPLENNGQTGAGIQVETSSEAAATLVYPYARSGDQWLLDDPLQPDTSLVPRFYAPPK